VGGPEDQPGFESSNEGSEWFDTKVTGLDNRPENPVPLYGTLELSEGSEGGRYTCAWGYQASNGDFYADMGGRPDIQRFVTSEIQQGWLSEENRGKFPEATGDGIDSSIAQEQFSTWNEQNEGTTEQEDADPELYTEISN